MNKKFTFVIAGLFFVLMTISNLLCSFFDVKIVISGYEIPLVPLEASIVAIIHYHYTNHLDSYLQGGLNVIDNDTRVW